MSWLISSKYRPDVKEISQIPETEAKKLQHFQDANNDNISFKLSVPISQKTNFAYIIVLQWAHVKFVIIMVSLQMLFGWLAYEFLFLDEFDIWQHFRWELDGLVEPIFSSIRYVDQF